MRGERWKGREGERRERERELRGGEEKRQGERNTYELSYCSFSLVAVKNLGVWVDHLIQNFEDVSPTRWNITGTYS